MIYHIVTVFPEIYTSFLSTSLIKRSIDNNLITINVYNLRDFAKDNRKTIDGKPYGGGPGMLLLVEPLYKAISFVRKDKKIPVYVFSPKGKKFNQQLATSVTANKEVILICPRYEGFDQRIVDIFKAQEISLGDFVLMGGDIPAMAFIEATARLVPNVVGKEESVAHESFSKFFLHEHPQYSAPRVFQNLSVPKTLVSGNHKEIEDWKKKESNSN